MKVRSLCVVLAIAVVAGFGSAASANGGRPSRQTLAAMGLGGLAIISDDAALSVRGQGGSHAAVWGSSWAQIAAKGGSAGSKNAYKAEGRHSAAGGNLSFAGVIITRSGGNGGHGGGGGYGAAGSNGGGHGGGKPKSLAIKVFAGGGSFAKGK